MFSFFSWGNRKFFFPCRYNYGSHLSWKKKIMDEPQNKQANRQKVSNEKSFNSFLDGTAVKLGADALGLI